MESVYDSNQNKQRIIQEFVPGKQVTMAHVIANPEPDLYKKLGVDSAVLRRISVCSYEVELNLVIHSLGGTIDFSVDEDGVTLLIRDRGPGIPDLDLAMREGWSTAPESVRNMGFGAGMGLPNMKRNADEFDIQSTVGVGTEILMKFHLK